MKKNLSRRTQADQKKTFSEVSQKKKVFPTLSDGLSGMSNPSLRGGLKFISTLQ